MKKVNLNFKLSKSDLFRLGQVAASIKNRNFDDHDIKRLYLIEKEKDHMESTNNICTNIYDETKMYISWCNKHNKNPKNPDSLKQYLKETSDAKTTNS